MTIRSSNAFIAFTVCLAIYTDIFLYSLVVPVLPFALTVRAGVKEEEVQRWTSIFLAVYGAALAVGSPICGWFADRSSSRRLPLLLGLVALGGATALLCAGSSLPLLLVGRFCQGLSASVIWTVGMALLSDTVGEEKIGQAMGYVAGATSLGALSGPLLGGIVYARAGYYAVFSMGFAVIALDIFFRLILVEKSAARQWEPEVETSATNQSSKPGIQTIQSSSGEEIQPLPMENDLPDSTPISQSEKISPALETPKWTQRLPAFVKLLRIPRLLVTLFGCFVQSSSLAAFDSVLPLFV